MEKKCKTAKWLSGEALQIAVKRREPKSKGEKERYEHLSAEFQRIARRDKKAFLSDQYKEIEENNRMRNTRDLFKKIRDIKGTFHAKMGLISLPGPKCPLAGHTGLWAPSTHHFNFSGHPYWAVWSALMHLRLGVPPAQRK